jgi:TonB family protein
MRTFIAFSLLLLATSLFGQQPAKPVFIHEVHGTVVDPTGAAMGGIRLFLDRDLYGATTDSSGEFDIKLSAGEHVITVDPDTLYSLRIFLRIVDNGLNPNNVTFNLDPSEVCCSISSVSFPVPLSLPKPAYPPAARAVRARGEVIVAVKIGADGKVTEAKSLSGHPLMRRASEAAARGAEFEPSSEKERFARLFYIYISYGDKVKEGLRTYSNPYQIRIVAAEEILTY